jgi:hypothetical protein
MTSIEWLMQELYTEMNLSGDGRVLDEILKEAKEMHRQEIIDAYETSHISMMTSEQYYQETFVSKGSDEAKQFSMDKELCINHSIVIPKLEFPQQEIEENNVEVLDEHIYIKYLEQKILKLFTEEQIRETIAKYKVINLEEIIQSLKQHKKD